MDREVERIERVPRSMYPGSALSEPIPDLDEYAVRVLIRPIVLAMHRHGIKSLVIDKHSGDVRVTMSREDVGRTTPPMAPTTGRLP